MVHNMVNSSSLVYERQAFLTAGMNDKEVDYGLEDYESVISMISKGFHGVIIPAVHFYYRIRKDSMIRSITNEKWLYSYKYIAHKHKELYKEHAVAITNLLNANGPGFLYDNPSKPVPGGLLSRAMDKIEQRGREIVKKYPAVKPLLLRLSKTIKR